MAKKQVKQLNDILTAEQGVIKGEMHAKVNIAQNLLDEGMSVDNVVNNTGLREEAVNNLCNDTCSENK